MEPEEDKSRGPCLFDVADRLQFRAWLQENHAAAEECWVAVKRGRPEGEGTFWYIDAVEEALCFGWIDSTQAVIGGVRAQRFSPRRKGGVWSELNKERVRRLEKLGLMTDAGRRVLPAMGPRSFRIDPELEAALKKHRLWTRFQSFPPLYRRVRAFNLANIKAVDPASYEKALEHFLAETRKGNMYGQWDDYGRLSDYRTAEPCLYTVSITPDMAELTLDDFCQDEIYVLDTETTGLKGAPDDVVVDIGITRVSLSKGTVKDVYSSVVGYDVEEWNDYRRNAWIFENTDLTLDMVAEAPPLPYVIDDVRRILRGKWVTSYNIEYDMNKFLYLEPWFLRGTFRQCEDIMKAATPVCKLPSEYYGRQYRYPKLDVAYSMIVDGDPAGINGVQDHRALSDARMASYVMIAMWRNHDYRPRCIQLRLRF